LFYYYSPLIDIRLDNSDIHTIELFSLQGGAPTFVTDLGLKCVCVCVFTPLNVSILYGTEIKDNIITCFYHLQLCCMCKGASEITKVIRRYRVFELE
jgi:hypothetical protein